jgi:cell division transport system permease protein
MVGSSTRERLREPMNRGRPIQRFAHRLRYFCVDAWDEWWHNPGVNLLALATLTSVLFLAGLVVLALFNVEHRIRLQGWDVRVEVYLLDSIDPQQTQTLREILQNRPGVARVEFVDKAEALRRYGEWSGEMAALIGDLEINPLPASFDVFLVAGPQAQTTAERLVVDVARRPGVEEARYDREWQQRVESMLAAARRGAAGMGVVVFLAVAMIIAGVLRMAVYARRDEIEIMLLVGATPAFVRGPFLVGGLARGLLASLLALGIVELIRRVGLATAPTALSGLFDLLASRPLSFSLSVWMAVAGLAIGLLGSLIAIRRPELGTR